MNITLNLTDQQVQRVLNILEQAPYIITVDIINSINMQIKEQLKQAKK